MELDHFLHGRDVVLRNRLCHTTATRVSISWEWSHRPGHPRALFVGFARHDGGDGAAKRPALHAVVPVPVTRNERAEVGVTEPKGAKDVRVLRDLLDRIARVIDNDFLRGDVNADGLFEPLHVEHAVLALELL